MIVMITIAKRARPMRLIEWPEGSALIDATYERSFASPAKQGRILGHDKKGGVLRSTARERRGHFQSG